MRLPNVYPIHDQALIREEPGTLESIGFIPMELGVTRGLVVRLGAGVSTRHGVIPPILRIGDDVVFMTDLGIKFKHGDSVYFLVSEWTTSAIMNRDPLQVEIPSNLPGLDVDAIINRAETELSVSKKDPDSSDTQD